jgi:phosphomannomutase
MKISKPKNLQDKELIVFDLDGTLSESKSPMDAEMAGLLTKLLEKKKVSVIGGGIYSIFQSQFLKSLNAPAELLKNLYLFPTTGTVFYRYSNGWQKVYSLDLTNQEKNQIRQAFDEVLKKIKYVKPAKVYGELLEDRETQMTYSFLGQDIVKVLGKKGLKLKTDWRDQNNDLKLRVARLVGKRLPKFEVRAAGYTSIDVTRKGVDKAYGLRQMQSILKIPIDKMLFVGDAIFRGGNDYAALKTKVDYVAVRGPTETKALIRKLY